MPDNYGWKRDFDNYISVMTTLPPDSETTLQLINVVAASLYAKHLGVSAKLTLYMVPICVEDPCKNIASEQ